MSNPDLLRGVPLLAVLPDDELDRLAQRARPRQYRAGTIIFHRDDPGAALHIITAGLVKLVLTSLEGREVTVGILRPGDFFGELALLDGGPRSASAIALDAVETLTLDRTPFVAILERQPQMASALLAVLGDRLRRTDELVQDILFLDLPGRLAKQLLALAGEHGVPGAGGTRIDLRLNQSDLAAIVGATRESVNRCLNAYAERGLLRVERDAITILQPEALQDRIY
ncbi:MAG TPA: Crp/Fnr family transcriptional regulator [Thermomicrobiales bacterium]|jgi:CRP/FNR family transcriptional regulator/CRP/FNR family cyclic AMP-dependent transcriptional regulator|nr:Crp/Fnr family transcriptional regulator [Thermomicrobiales bacterium]